VAGLQVLHDGCAVVRDEDLLRVWGLGFGVWGLGLLVHLAVRHLYHLVHTAGPKRRAHELRNRLGVGDVRQADVGCA
jgi:hypothetical protein